MERRRRIIFRSLTVLSTSLTIPTFAYYMWFLSAHDTHVGLDQVTFKGKGGRILWVAPAELRVFYIALGLFAVGVVLGFIRSTLGWKARQWKFPDSTRNPK